MPSVGTMTLNAASLISANPVLIQEIAAHTLAHVLYSQIRRITHRRGLTRSSMRKLVNRKRRRFTDNIIMHHKRLHDKNREIIVSNARSRALARRGQAKKESPSLERARDLKTSDVKMKYATGSLKERGEKLRGHVDARRMRARSRWLSVMSNG